MGPKSKMTTDNQSSQSPQQEERSQVQGTTGAEMPDPDRHSEAPTEADIE
jgi:hypothetical protein